jgi:hypothetical protein
MLILFLLSILFLNKYYAMNTKYLLNIIVRKQILDINNHINHYTYPNLRIVDNFI